jgi:hypothetical protein
MSNFLQQLFSSPAPAAPPPAPTGQQERHARANGFRSANEMMLWQQNRERPGGSISEQQRPSMSATTAILPKNILGYVLGKTTGALGY